MPNAATSDDTARTSGTSDATNAPNVMSRMMNVKPIVMNVRSSPLLIRFVMSSLVSVWLTDWTTNPSVFASSAAIAGLIATSRPSTVAWSPSM